MPLTNAKSSEASSRVQAKAKDVCLRSRILHTHAPTKPILHVAFELQRKQTVNPDHSSFEAVPAAVAQVAAGRDLDCCYAWGEEGGGHVPVLTPSPCVTTVQTLR